MIGDRHTDWVTARGPQSPDSFPGPPLSPCWVPDNWLDSRSKPPGLGVSSPQCDWGVLGLKEVRTPARLLWGISGGVEAPALQHSQASPVAPGSCTVHLLPGSPACSCLAGGQVHSSWASLDLYGAFQLVKTLTAKEQRRDGERLLVRRVPQVCGQSARTAVCPAPAPDVAWREGSGRGEGRERGGFLRSEDQFLPVWLPVPLWSRVFAPQHSAQPEASPFSARDAGPPERPGETLSSLLSAGPSFRATLPPARHCLPSPVHFRGFASSSRLTWSGRWSPPIKTHSRWAAERKQGPL